MFGKDGCIISLPGGPQVVEDACEFVGHVLRGLDDTVSSSLRTKLEKEGNTFRVPLDLPIACTLSETELQERGKTMLDSSRAETVEAVSLPSGCSYSFSAGPESSPGLLISWHWNTSAAGF